MNRCGRKLDTGICTFRPNHLGSCGVLPRNVVIVNVTWKEFSKVLGCCKLNQRKPESWDFEAVLTEEEARQVRAHIANLDDIRLVPTEAPVARIVVES